MSFMFIFIIIYLINIYSDENYKIVSTKICIYSPALEKWGYTGFTLSFRGSVIPSFRGIVDIAVWRLQSVHDVCVM